MSTDKNKLVGRTDLEIEKDETLDPNIREAARQRRFTVVVDPADAAQAAPTARTGKKSVAPPDA